MIEYSRLVLKLKNQRGVAAILVGILILILLGCVAFAVDAGYLMVTRNELQNVSDAAALAAARKLGSIYEPMSYAQQQIYVCQGSDLASIISVAQEVGRKNKAAMKNITINDADVIIGTWDTKTKILTPTLNQPDAVKVIARRDDAANGPIATVFGKVLGKDTFNVTGKATAALTGLSTVDSGGLPLPVGIDEGRFPACQQNIEFYPTSSCAGWHNYDDPKNGVPSDPDLVKTIQGLTDGTYKSPATTAGKTQFNFKGGTESQQVFDAFDALFQKNKGSDGTWITAVPIYKNQECGNPRRDILIVGFATAIIQEVIGAPGKDNKPSKSIIATIICNDVEPGRGSGGEFGTKGSISGLVQ